MDKFERAIEVLNQGGIIIFPTDTAFGVGCRLDRPQAIEKLFQMRKRPPNQASPVLVDSISMARRYFVDPNPLLSKLMEKYWPGALTLIGKCDPKLVHPLVRGQGETIGLRWPDHASIQQLISAVDVPILGPSANFHGFPTPFGLEELDPELVKLVDFVLAGECRLVQVSTVVDATGDQPRIIRQGAVNLDVNHDKVSN